ncbi:MAG TPA: NblA/ycf18 family protein [Cyanophyceae cyanobacterium]
MNQPMELSLEQQFSIRSFADQVQHMSREQAQEFLLMLYQQMMIKEAMYLHFLKQEWKLDSDAITYPSKDANSEGL